MNASKKDLEDAIMHFAKKFNQEEPYVGLMGGGIVMPKLVELIIYDMFVNQFSPYDNVEEDFLPYVRILLYSKELRENGFVTYNES